MRMEPPPSVPSASVVMPAATAAPAPPEEPPGVYSRFHGLRVTPQSGLWVAPEWANSGSRGAQVHDGARTQQPVHRRCRVVGAKVL